MGKTLTLTLDAKAGPFVQSMLDAYSKVQHLEGGVEKLTRTTGRMATRMEEAGDASGKAARASTKMNDVMGAMQSRIMSIAGPGALLALFAQGLARVREEAETGAQALEAALDSMRQLAQVSRTPEELKLGLLSAERAALESGMTVSEANQLVFGQRSFMLTPQDLQDIAQTQLFSAQGGPERFMAGVGKFRAPAAFGEGVGTARQLISAFLAAGGPSDIPSDVIAQAAINALGPLKTIGTSPDEILALMSVLSPGFESPDVAATSLRSLATVIRRQKLGGQGLMAGLAGMSQADFDEFARAEAAKISGAAVATTPSEIEQAAEKEQRAYRALVGIRGNEALIAQRTAEVAAARATGSEFEQKLATVQAVPELSVAQNRRIMQIAKEISDRTLGMREIEYQTLLDAYEVMSETAERQGVGGIGDTPMGRFFQRFWLQRNREVFGAESSMPALRRIVGVQDAAEATRRVQEILDAELQGQADEMRRTDDARRLGVTPMQQTRDGGSSVQYGRWRVPQGPDSGVGAIPGNQPGALAVQVAADIHRMADRPSYTGLRPLWADDREAWS